MKHKILVGSLVEFTAGTFNGFQGFVLEVDHEHSAASVELEVFGSNAVKCNLDELKLIAN
ncbi:MAG: hypothetical protein CMJ78_10840 [Planctomycetaceae bacterium]|nr:hypothetical protein [Planctomycetaceae bacterium]